MSEIIQINPENPEHDVLHKAVKIMSRGGVIVYPTDTLYGLGVSASHNEAMERLFTLKGREKDQPVSLMVNSIEKLSRITGPLWLEEKRLAKQLFPGKITLIVPVRQKIHIRHMEHLFRIGFRIPDSPICHHLVELNGAPVTTTSANLSKQGNLRTVKEIAEAFNDQVDIFLDAGHIKSKHGSSVLDISFSPPVLVREGDLPRQTIEKKIGYAVNDHYPDKYQIAFICSGNICRSPMAEGILRRDLKKTKYHSMVGINSAGTLQLPQTLAASEAVGVSEEMGIDIGNHLSRPVSFDIILRSNLIICMALNHYQFLLSKYPNFREKIILLKQWGRTKSLTNPSIPDPIGQNKDYFLRIFVEIEREIQRILPDISRHIGDFVNAHPKSLNF